MAKRKKRFFSLYRLLNIVPFKILLIGSAFAAGYFYINPSQIPDAKIRNQVETYKQDNQNTTQDQIVDVLGNATQKATDIIKNTKIPEPLLNQEDISEEIVVEDVVNNFTEEIKQLPEKQVKKIKYQICQDVISEATQSGQ